MELCPDKILLCLEGFLMCRDIAYQFSEGDLPDCKSTKKFSRSKNKPDIFHFFEVIRTEGRDK